MREGAGMREWLGVTGGGEKGKGLNQEEGRQDGGEGHDLACAVAGGQQHGQEGQVNQRDAAIAHEQQYGY